MHPATDPAEYGEFEFRPDDYVEMLDVRARVEGEARVKEVIGALLELRGGLSVLGTGTGTGTDALRLAGLVAPGGKVVGLDHSADVISEASRRADGSGLPVEFVQGDAHAVDYADESFDRCRCDRVLILEFAHPLRHMVDSGETTAGDVADF
jgi:ubiquinone/menaquinone biosynthesis C-methylase UbiE